MTTVVVLHSTEGASLEGAVATLRGNGSPSHEVWDARDREQVQLLDLSLPAKSLMHLRGQPDTNNRDTDRDGRYDVKQIELVGFASSSSAAGRSGLIVPEMNDDELEWLGARLREFCFAVGAPFVFPCAFAEYPSSYGPNNGVRLSLEDFATVEGVIGHQHVPENDHGDPGALNVARMLELIAPRPAAPTIPTTEAPAMLHLIVTDDPAFPTSGPNPTPGVHLVYTGNRLAWIRSGDALGILDRGGVPTVATTVAEVAAMLSSIPGDGPSPSSAGASVGW